MSADFSSLRGECPAITAARHLLACAAATGHPVLLTGEPGTGKRLAATLLASGRRAAVLRPHQLAPETLLAWLTPPAGPDVLILTQPNDLPLAVQQRLARILADVGWPASRPARLITLSRHDPLHPPGNTPPLRPELYFTLAAIHIHLPPLRYRPGDVERLLRQRLAERLHVAPEAITLDAAAVRRLTAHPWPDNVRELLALADELAPRLSTRHPVLTDDLLPTTLGTTALLGTSAVVGASPPPGLPTTAQPLEPGKAPSPEHALEVIDLTSPALAPPGTPFSEAIIPLAELERRAIEHALRMCSGDIRLAARRLGLDEADLRDRLRAPSGRPSTDAPAGHAARSVSRE